MKKIQSLDGLRGLAVLMILLAHLPVLVNGPAAGLLNGIPAIMRLGYLGVDIFFALSGFLITRILIKEKNEHHFSFKRFYARRSLRIFPAYYTCLLLSGLLISWDQLLPVAFYYNNYYSSFHDENAVMAHTWTLAVEEHFYLLWPLLIYFLSLKQARRVLLFVLPAFAIVSAVAAYFLFSRGEAIELLYKSTNSRILTLALGSFLAFREREIQNMKMGNMLFYFLLAVMLYIFCLKIPFGQDPPVKRWMNFFIMTPVSLIVLALTISIDRSNAAVRFVFTNAVVRYIGRISYGLYLYHLPVYFLMDAMPGEDYNVPVAKALAAFGCTLIVATISYYVVERPFLQLKDRVS